MIKIQTEDIKLYKGDCLEVMDKLIEQGIKVDAIICDPPYGTVKGVKGIGMEGKVDWDTKIDVAKMYERCEKLLREKGALILFSQDPYTMELIYNQHQNIPFSYRLVWEKDHFANGLMSKKAPVNYFEDINVFFRKYDIYNENPLREYFKKVMLYIGTNSCKDINLKLGHRKAEHCFYIDSTQFKLCTRDTYDELVSIYNLKNMDGFKDYDDLYNENLKYSQVFNLDSGNKIKSNILKYKKDYDGFHPTQKPVKLLVDLIETYTNVGDLVLDFTMGSGSTGVACVSTNRKFIGIELDDTYFKIAKNRIEETLKNQGLQNE